jgi:hypothetical protein
MNIALGVPTISAPIGDHDQEKKSKWDEMRLEEIPLWCYISASVFKWVMLAGFLVLPSSFSELEQIETDSGQLRKVFQALRNIPLYVSLPPTYLPSSNHKRGLILFSFFLITV